jgi:N-carbamoyl-L-amino-acid hydrolase
MQGNTHMVKRPEINGERLWQRLMRMAEIGATPAGGCNRQALTDEDAAGRALLVRWCEEAGCEVFRDSIGNIFARRPGTQGTAGVVMTGSHLDTQPSGGKFDGIYGVLAGLEVFETLNDLGIETAHPLELVVWTNEEGCRFDPAMMGSAVWSGKLPLQQAWGMCDLDGHSVEEELARTGQKGADRPRQEIHAAFELHIEQGPVLEAQGIEIGIVTGVQHMCRYRVSIRGQETHAGPSPMAMRRDPMMAVSRVFPELYQLAEQYGPGARVTLGYIQATPGSPNTVPGEVEFTVDIRHPDASAYTAMREASEQSLARACGALELEWEAPCVWEAPGVSFAEHCIESVRRAVSLNDYSAREMISGAGHDACNIAEVAPISMIFIPCEGGLSHNEAENIQPNQAQAGANILLHAILDSAGG